jgi:hypothetical protein
MRKQSRDAEGWRIRLPKSEAFHVARGLPDFLFLSSFFFFLIDPYGRIR